MKKIWYLLFVLLLANCTPSNQVYHDFQQDFPDYKWEKNKVLSFVIPIKDIQSKHNLKLDFRHLYGFPYANLNLEMEFVLPSGEKELKAYAVPVIEEDKSYNSECSGDYCDLSYVLEEEFVFPEVGEYHVRLHYADDMEFLNAVMGVGLIVEKAQ